MQIPVGESGFSTVSATQLRRYGAGGFRIDALEVPRGCPRLYHAIYVDKRTQGGSNDAMKFGRVVHEAFYRMEENDETPEEALAAAWPVDMGLDHWAEALNDLRLYMERGATPRDRFQVIDVEVDLRAQLYVDDEFGPIWYRGILDVLSLDPDYPNVLHVVDYKTNRSAPSMADVLGDVQMRGYAWLALQCAREKYGIVNPRVVVHLDAVKWREYEVTFDEDDLEEWHSWVVAIVRKILRDTDAEPVLNQDCCYCPVRLDCPAYAGLPETAGKLAAELQGIEDPVERLKWRDAANKVRLLLEKSVKSIDEEFQDRARREVEVVVGETKFVLETSWGNEFDLPSLHRVFGDQFYNLVTTSKRKVDDASKSWPTDRRAEVLAAMRRVPIGSTVERRKVDTDD
jgi:CRISPR/Cas system-associated exonuclease Cas4 (RecB family)